VRRSATSVLFGKRYSPMPRILALKMLLPHPNDRSVVPLIGYRKGIAPDMLIKLKGYEVLS
jgi:hypothetical protein